MSLAERVLNYLARAEDREIDPWLRDDLHIAWLTVLFADRGSHQPFVAASYEVLGLHPEKVWPSIVAYRKALLGSSWNADDAKWAGENFVKASLSSKKPVQSERSVNWRLRKRG